MRTKYWMEKQFNNTTYNIIFICYICVYAHMCRKAWKCLNSLFILNFPLYFFSALSPINRYIFYIRSPKSLTDHAHPCQSLRVLTVPSCSRLSWEWLSWPTCQKLPSHEWAESGSSLSSAPGGELRLLGMSYHLISLAFCPASGFHPSSLLG